MRKLSNLLILTILSALLSACFENTRTTTSTNNGPDDPGGVTITQTDDDDDDDDEDPNPIGTSSCTGTTADGVGEGPAIFQQDMFLAGHQTWVPGNYFDPLATSTMPTVQSAMLLFRSDSRLKVRFKVNSQPIPTVGEVYCFGRETGGASDQYVYTKLRFRLTLRDVLCDTPDPGNPNNCLSGFYLGSPYQSQFSQPVSVDSCSQIYDLGALRNQTTYGTVVSVDDVKADSTCQANGTYCPAEKLVRTRSCWHMTMQISTDYTQDLQ